MKTIKFLSLPLLTMVAMFTFSTTAKAQGGLEITITSTISNCYEGTKTDVDCANDPYTNNWGSYLGTGGWYIGPATPSGEDRTVDITVTDCSGNSVTVYAPGWGSPQTATMANGEKVTFHSEDGCTGHPAVVSIE